MIIKYCKILSFFILLAIGFVFLHSELDLFSPEHHTHISHDFCDIVDNAKTERSVIFKFKINSNDVPVIFFSVPANLFGSSFITNINTSTKPKPEIDIPVFYSALLI